MTKKILSEEELKKVTGGTDSGEVDKFRHPTDRNGSIDYYDGVNSAQIGNDQTTEKDKIPPITNIIPITNR